MGEETGGGWYGNNGIIIPDIVLPNTKIRVRLPLFRLLQFEHDKVPQKGTGVIPNIYCGPSLDALIHKVDNKMEAVIKTIMAKKKGNRIQVILECTEHKTSGLAGVSRYITTKNRKNTPERIELKKFNPIMKKVTVHKEIK